MVVAIFGPTASRQDRGRGGARRPRPARGRLRRLDAGLPGPADPHEPAERADAARRRSGRSTTRRSVGEYARLAHAAIDEILARGPDAGRRRRHRPLPPRGARRPRRCRRRRRRARASAGSGSTTRRRRARRTRCSPSAIPRPPRRVHPNDRRRVVRALELAEAGASLAPGATTGSGPARRGTRRCSSGSTSRATSSSARIEAADARRCSSAGVEDEVARGARRADLDDRAQGRSASTRSPSCRASEAIDGDRRSARAATPRTSASGCGASRASLCVAADRPPGEIADEILDWHALGNVYLLVERAELARR